MKRELLPLCVDAVIKCKRGCNALSSMNTKTKKRNFDAESAFPALVQERRFKRHYACVGYILR